MRRGARYLSAIQISDDEMDAVCIFRASRGFIFEKIKISILFQNSCQIKLKRQMMVIYRCQ